MGDDRPPLHRRREQDGRAGTSLASWLGLGLELALALFACYDPLRPCLLACVLAHVPAYVPAHVLTHSLTTAQVTSSAVMKFKCTGKKKAGSSRSGSPGNSFKGGGAAAAT